MKLIVQIPCLNEEDTLPATVKDIPREVPGIDKVEILIIDDGSTDRTVKVAREMRKYYVSLLVVDQRPSGIDEEVLSQLGTKITALLNDEKDIQGVLTGVSNAAGLRSVLASLDSKQQALMFGHAVPMPVVIKTRNYDEDFYRAMGDLTEEEKAEKAEAASAALFGD